MQLVKFDVICRSAVSRAGARLVSLRHFYPSTYFIQALARFVGTFLLNFSTRRERPILVENSLRILGKDIDEANEIANNYILRRSTRFIYSDLIKKRYFESFSVSLGDVDNVEDGGGVFCMLHTVDSYLLPAQLARQISPNDPVILLRAPLDSEEEHFFKVIAEGACVSAEYCNPASSTEIRAAVRGIKNGRRILTYIDMPASFGRSPHTWAFGRRIWMAMGGVEIARLAKAHVYLCYFSQTAKQTEARQMSLNIKSFGLANAQTAARIAVHAGDVITTSPAMWDPLISMRSYLYQPSAISGGQE